MGKLIIPKTYIKDLGLPLIFLAGPIKSAPNWQDEALGFLFSHSKDIIIASPRRGTRDRITQYILQGDENYFSRQRAWERHYLDIASKTGAIMFWLPREEKHDCNKVYGAMTRLELGQAFTNYRHDNNFRFCIGSDGNFPELHTIRYDLSLDAPNKIIFSSLEETCLEALRIANSK